MDQDDTATALSAAVEHAYSVFAGYRPGTKLAVCHCTVCMDDETERILLTTPLREIEYETLCEYTWAANGTNDPKFDSNELRYFLPRYFEFIAGGDWPAFSDPEPTLRQLGTLNYRANWPALEVDAVDQFFAALFANELAKPLTWYKSESGDHREASGIEDTLCCIAYGGGDMAPRLETWERRAFQHADDHLASLAAHCSDDHKHGLWSAFWSGNSQNAKVVATWIRRPETIERLQRALSKLQPGKETELYSRALQNLQKLCK